MIKQIVHPVKREKPGGVRRHEGNSVNLTEIAGETRKELSPFLQRLDYDALSKHNRGYLRYKASPVEHFIDAELARYLFTLKHVSSSVPRGKKILDIGFFIPFLPICFCKLGYEVHSIEKLELYGGALDEIITYTKSRYHIDIIDHDLFSDAETQGQTYEVILLLAVIEHLSGSPKSILKKLHRLMDSDSQLIVEVPNVASLSKRLLMLLKGIAPYPPIEEYFHSEYPFSGHNREYTINDVNYILSNSGYDVISISTFNQSLKRTRIKEKMLSFAEKNAPPSFKPFIWANAKKRPNAI